MDSSLQPLLETIQRRKPLEVKEALKVLSAKNKAHFLNTNTPCIDRLELRTQQIDTLLTTLWQQTFSDQHTEGLALIACGGYGRSELHPHSDIDIMVLLNNPASSAQQAKLSELVQFLWDTGLDMGHSVRTLKECLTEAQDDITVITNLIESRPICGDSSLFPRLHKKLTAKRLWPAKDFFKAKTEEQKNRHRRFHDTGYNLEPNIKESPGGLRDIQTIVWIAKRHFGSTSLEDLVSHQFTTPDECTALIKHRQFLWRVRCHLHDLTNRKEDRLTFDHQRTIAEQMGYRDKDNHLAVEQFMRQYYRTVMEVSRLNEMLLQLFDEALHITQEGQCLSLNNRFQVHNGFIEIKHPNTFKKYPFALLEIFLLLQQNAHIQGVRATTIRQIRRDCHLIDRSYYEDLRNRSLFLEIIRQPEGITHELRRMNRYGVLARYVPAFEKIVGLMQYDLFHVLTVDEHTLFVVRNLRRFFVPEFFHEFPFCSALAIQLPKPELLYLAGLFHDIAKGRGGKHAILGAIEARDFCLHHSISDYDANIVAWLVEHHLLMSQTAQRMDISDPQVVNRFAELVGDENRLNYLYLLTVADIRATSPKLWNGFKDSLLSGLYASTRRAFLTGLENPTRQQDHISEIKTAALTLLDTHYHISAESAQTHWNNLHDDYFLKHSPDEIAWHGQVILQQKSTLPRVATRAQTQRGGTELFVYAGDQDLLFSHITHTLAKMGLNVMDARIITTTDHHTLDTFIVLEENGLPVSEEHRLQTLQENLHKQLATLPEICHIEQRIGRKNRHFSIPTQLNMSTDTHKQQTILEVSTADTPGVLSRLGDAFTACDIRLHNAKIATYGERAQDTFFITNQHTQQALDHTQSEQLKTTILQHLDYHEPRT